MYSAWIDTSHQSDANKRRLGVGKYGVTLRHRSTGLVRSVEVEALDRYQAMQQARSLLPHHTIVRLVQIST